MATRNENIVTFRAKWIPFIEKLPEDLPLLLSGGVDSATILATLLELERNPDIFTFQLGEFESEDIQVSRSMCEEFGLTHHIVKMPQTQEQLKKDIKYLVETLETNLVTHIQCSQPFLYLLPAIEQCGFKTVLHGMAADHIYGMGRHSSQLRREQGEAAFIENRIWGINDMEQPSTQSIPKLAALHNITLIDPYRQNVDFMSWAVNLTWDEMHNPYEKALGVQCFPDFWSRGNWYRKHNPYHYCSGIRDWHGTLDEETVKESGSTLKAQKKLRSAYNRVVSES